MVQAIIGSSSSSLILHSSWFKMDFIKFNLIKGVLAAGQPSRQHKESEITNSVPCLSLLCLFGLSLSYSVFHGPRSACKNLLHLSLTHKHINTWKHTHNCSLSLLCHFEFLSHLFHGLIRASDDRTMSGGGAGWRKGEGQGTQHSPGRTVSQAKWNTDQLSK